MSVLGITTVLGLALAGSPNEASEASAPEASSATHDEGPTPFVQVGLGGGPLFRESHGNWTTTGGPAFAVEAGTVWNPLRRLRVSIGGGLVETGQAPAFINATTELLAKSRIGVGTSRVWGYGIVGAGLSLYVQDYGYGSELRVGPAALAGLGVRARVGPRVSVGLDVESTLAALPPVGRTTRLSGLLVVEVRFGR